MLIPSAVYVSEILNFPSVKIPFFSKAPQFTSAISSRTSAVDIAIPFFLSLHIAQEVNKGIAIINEFVVAAIKNTLTTDIPAPHEPVDKPQIKSTSIEITRISTGYNFANLINLFSPTVAVDSAISSAVIENIFFPKAPLHDGAMVIRDNRIHSAGCILPLTQNEISKELGTRHRAAIGVTEHSDALVVIVSEETGAISLANGGTLVRNLTFGELNEELTEYMAPEEAKTAGFKLKRRKK